MTTENIINIKETVFQRDKLTQYLYVLMGMFGLISLIFALSPLSLQPRLLFTGLTFGIAAGIWIAYLLMVVYNSSTENLG